MGVKQQVELIEEFILFIQKVVDDLKVSLGIVEALI